MVELSERVRRALLKDRTIDIITTGAKSGLARRTEIWFTNIGGRIVICGTPSGDGTKGRRVGRDWLANLKVHPEFLFCLKESIHAQLPASAVPITDPEDRRALMSAPETRWYRDQGYSVDDLVESSPIVEVFFEASPVDVELRLAGAGDVPAITEIYNQAVALRSATADTDPVTVESRRAWLAAHSPDRYPVWVAEHEGVIVGWCSLSPHRPGRKALRYTAEIGTYIREGFRRHGIASRLMAHAIEQCPQLGIKSLFAILLDTNVPSVSALEKFGFEKWGHLPAIAEIDGRECGQFIYGRRVEHFLDTGEDLVVSLKLRATTEADAGFLYDVLRATMQAYVAQTWVWDEEEQQARFRREFDPAADQIIVLDGKDIGVISTENRADEVFLDKLYILPDYQRRGIGTYLIHTVLDRAFSRGLPVGLHVLKVNPAKRLYERLGFVQVGETDPSYLMKATPPG